MEKLIYCTIFLIPLGQLFKIAILPDLKILANDVLVFLVVALFFFKIKKKDFLIWLNKWRYFNIFLLIAFISWVLNLSNFSFRGNIISFLYLLRLFIYWAFFYVLWSFLKNRGFEKRILLNIFKFLLLAGFLVSVSSFISYFYFDKLRNIIGGEWDVHIGRAVGVFMDPVFTGGILVLYLILLFFLWKSPTLFRSHKWRRSIFAVLAFFSYLAMYLTYSRITYFMFFFSILLIYFYFKNPKFLIGAVMLFLITYFIFPRNISYGTKISRTETIFARIKNWHEGLLIFAKHPIVGVGFNNLKYARLEYLSEEKNKILKSNAAGGIDNSFIFTLVTTGFPGVLFYCFFWVDLLKRYLKILKTVRKKERMKLYINCLLFVSVCVIIFQSLFVNGLYYPFNLEWLFLLMAVGEGYY